MPKKANPFAAMAKGAKVPTPRKPSRGRTVPRAAASNLPDTMKPPFMGGGKTGRKKTRKAA